MLELRSLAEIFINQMSSKERRNLLISAGLCINACGRRAVDGTGQCAPCAGKNRINNRNAYRRKHGIELTRPLWKRAKPMETLCK